MSEAWAGCKRGAIGDRRRRQQIVNYEELRFGNITPTDMDGMIEYRGKGYVFMEFKLRAAPLKEGQRLCMERLVRDAWAAGKKAVALVLEHEVDDASRDIPAARCAVREYFYEPAKGWVAVRHYFTAYDMVSRFIAAMDGK